MGLEASDYNLLVMVCMLENARSWLYYSLGSFGNVFGLEVDGYFYAPLCMSTVCLCTMACKVGDPSEVLGLDKVCTAESVFYEVDCFKKTEKETVLFSFFMFSYCNLFCFLFCFILSQFYFFFV